MNVSSLPQLIGHTPLLRLRAMEQAHGLPVTLLAKLEMQNPSGSVKARLAAALLDSPGIGPDTVLIEPTSGNTGIGLAALAAPRGLRVILTMPDTMSPERCRLLSALGAQLRLTPGKLGMAGAVELAQKLHREIPGSRIPGQFDNPLNPQVHYRTTGPELWEDCGGAVDLFVAGIGTGGTITGVGRYLKEQRSAVTVVGVEPAGSAVLSGGRAGVHGIQGLGAGFVPRVLDLSVVDRLEQVTEEEAYAAARELGQREGVLCGISSGAALAAALRLGRLPQHRGKTLAVLLPDGGERYLSTRLFA